ncbi:hypothetical protein COY07_01650 [Candidatus Peregrinibacteria bacterium CG_4_10_14_0_2_um_filter_43_11]|nr:MAG: hypothetical protein COY07_01650 [Candidatus Peregrinibacteria bacterium CG_4_10_14_0_2_um_filter_43_11]
MKQNCFHHWGFTFVALLVFFLFGSHTAFADTTLKDVPRTYPYFLAINYLSQSGVVKGYGDSTFRPDNPVNRAEVVKIILEGLGIKVTNNFDASFPDVVEEDWFSPYVMTAKTLGVVKGDDETGTFSAGRNVNKAEFLKMLLIASQANLEIPQDQKKSFSDVSEDAWFMPYIQYAVTLGIISPNDQGLIYPAKSLTRGEVVEIMYLLILIQKGTDTQFLLDRTEDQLKQIEVYVAANQVALAKKTSKLAVDLSQQALKNMSGNNIVLGAAKLARAYDLLVDSYDLGGRGNYTDSSVAANEAIDRATEAWEANSATQPIARHIKERAREILAQVGGTEE